MENASKEWKSKVLNFNHIISIHFKYREKTKRNVSMRLQTLFYALKSLQMISYFYKYSKFYHKNPNISLNKSRDTECDRHHKWKITAAWFVFPFNS